jgi:hypothetical protein
MYVTRNSMSLIAKWDCNKHSQTPNWNTGRIIGPIMKQNAHIRLTRRTEGNFRALQGLRGGAYVYSFIYTRLFSYLGYTTLNE